MSAATPAVRPLVVLVGPMGAGKTTVGRMLAQAAGVGFRDTDADVETRAGKPVSEIFVDDGEAAFRELERDAVVTALGEHDGVLALGGGAVMTPAIRDALADHRVVFLQVGLADAVKRVGMGTGRPLLLGNVRARVKQLLDERTPVYESVATHVVDTDGRDAADVAALVRELLEEKR
ncbi:shikimate kinase [Nocardioides massiliensis]|uniref:Shikimate kinase n=1 Tax=Nocardioides massiliensis TaxID=1325935 RepID=A0ABT9NQY3_9ACTN|nr:shikimate kinase [Nocardioides massiliensis]MDP9822844.1 shikimate kinase [Nocardioides massiliensis]